MGSHYRCVGNTGVAKTVHKYEWSETVQTIHFTKTKTSVRRVYQLPMPTIRCRHWNTGRQTFTWEPTENRSGNSTDATT